MEKESLNRRDCSDEELFVSDTVEVINEEPERAGKEQYKFCSVGKRGQVTGRGAWRTGVEVSFYGRKVGCEMENLKKILT